VPRATGAKALTVVEAGTGFAFLAAVIGYFPVIYQAFSRREVAISLLDARAGSPPSASELLWRHRGDPGTAALTDLLRDWERWAERPDNWQTSAWDRVVRLPARGATAAEEDHF